MEFNPWKGYSPDEPILPLEIEAPPCSLCDYWSPRVLADNQGDYNGIRLCLVETQCRDFSCYVERTP